MKASVKQANHVEDAICTHTFLHHMVAIFISCNRGEMQYDGSKNPFLFNAHSKFNRVIGHPVDQESMKNGGAAQQLVQERPDEWITWTLRQHEVDHPNTSVIHHQLNRIILNHMHQLVKRRDACKRERHILISMRPQCNKQ